MQSDIYNIVRNTMKSQWFLDFYKAAGIYFLWIFLHWCSVQTYQYFCAPLSFWGLFFGASFASQMPHCRGALWLLNFTHQSISQMWVFLGIWISTRLMSIVSKKEEQVRKRKKTKIKKTKYLRVSAIAGVSSPNCGGKVRVRFPFMAFFVGVNFL